MIYPVQSCGSEFNKSFWNTILEFEEFEYIKIHTKDKIFTCIKKLLVNNKVFKTMLSNDNYKEAKTNIIDLTEFDSKYVKPLLEYIVSNNFKIKNDEIEYEYGTFTKGEEIFEKEFISYLILFEKFLINTKSIIYTLFKISRNFNFYKLFVNLNDIYVGEIVEHIKFICLINIIDIYLSSHIDKKYVSDKQRSNTSCVKIIKNNYSFEMESDDICNGFVILNKEMTEEEISNEFTKIYKEDINDCVIKEFKTVLDNFTLDKAVLRRTYQSDSESD